MGSADEPNRMIHLHVEVSADGERLGATYATMKAPAGWQTNEQAVVAEPIADPVKWDPASFVSVAEGDSPSDFEPQPCEHEYAPIESMLERELPRICLRCGRRAGPDPQQAEWDAANRATVEAEIAASSPHPPLFSQEELRAEWEGWKAIAPEMPEDAYLRTRFENRPPLVVTVDLEPEDAARIDAAFPPERHEPPAPYTAEVILGKRRVKRVDITGPFKHIPRAFHISPDHLAGLDVLIAELNRLHGDLVLATDLRHEQGRLRKEAEKAYEAERERASEAEYRLDEVQAAHDELQSLLERLQGALTDPIDRSEPS